MTAGNTLWETNSSNHTIIPGGIFVSWLVSLASEEIKAFIVKGLSDWLLLRLLTASSLLPSDPLSSTYFIYFTDLSDLSSSRRLSSLVHSSSSRSLSISDPGMPIFISPNKTLTTWTIREYIPGVSTQRLYLLSPGDHEMRPEGA